VPVSVFDGKTLPFSDRTFDTVLFCDVLHHMDSPQAMLQEAVRVARKNVLIKDHVADGWLARPTLRLMDFVGNAPHGVVLPYNYLMKQQWQEVIDSVGLSAVAKSTRLSLYPRWADALFGRSLHFVALYRLKTDGLSVEHDASRYSISLPRTTVHAP
jgi:SAM-dependent methyltransferase